MQYINLKFNKNYFDKIDTTDKAYWIGFIWCDGYLNYRNRNGTESYDFKLSLIEKDINHLNIFKWYLDSNHIIRKYEIKVVLMLIMQKKQYFLSAINILENII